MQFQNSYASALEGCYVPWQGAEVPAPEILRLNEALAEELSLDVALLHAQGAPMLCGAHTPADSRPLAMAYAGHQFGNFSPQLGDGRALLLGELMDRDGQLRDLHLKGSGATPFSRGGDGKAALGPVLREYLIGEAMHALGVPTTRALAAVATGEQVARDTLLPGAVLARIASSHIRVGTFQFLAARQDTDGLRRLADYTVARHFADLADSSDRYLGFLKRVIERQALLVAHWMRLGFVHGVMNTDNTTISGETIDYGPCAFLDAYDERTVFSSIDHGGRYAYGNQPAVAQWNLARLAEALLPLIDAEDIDAAVERATEALKAFPGVYQAYWLDAMRSKLGLHSARDGDLALINELLVCMGEAGADFTLTFRRAADIVRQQPDGFTALFKEQAAVLAWVDRYQERLAKEPVDMQARATGMDRVNPLYIPRNHKVEEALEQAHTGDLTAFDRLLAAVTNPYEERADLSGYELGAPPGAAQYRTFCGT